MRTSDPKFQQITRPRVRKPASKLSPAEIAMLSHRFEREIRRGRDLFEASERLGYSARFASDGAVEITDL